MKVELIMSSGTFRMSIFTVMKLVSFPLYYPTMGSVVIGAKDDRVCIVA